ncbi:hypothetical protein ALC53_12622 [Atta colombica]|uniref:Uncharacterized protein n=1 Tax=Atta colombica TaxID=520822 RepID=A0A151HYX6_9HYME|nr:hypothetical protein ALC53_12622 [Atta colombica]
MFRSYRAKNEEIKGGIIMEKIAQKHDVVSAIEFFLQSLELIRRELLYAGLISSTMHRGTPRTLEV